MPKTLHILKLSLLLVFFFLTPVKSEENPYKHDVLRPTMVAVADPCVLIAAEGSYAIPKGSAIDIDISLLSPQGCTSVSIGYYTSFNGVLKKTPQYRHIYTGYGGDYEILEYSFKALKRGNDIIVITINGTEYLYHVEVW